MLKHIKNLNWKKVLITSSVYMIIVFVIRTIEAIITMNFYTIPEYFGLWSKVMMPAAGPPPVSFQITSLLFSLISGVALVIFFEYIKPVLPKKPLDKTIYFTKIIVLLSFIFFTLPVYLMFNIPFMLLVSWFITSVIIMFLSSMVFVKVMK